MARFIDQNMSHTELKYKQDGYVFLYDVVCEGDTVEEVWAAVFEPIYYPPGEDECGQANDPIRGEYEVMQLLTKAQAKDLCTMSSWVEGGGFRG